MRNDPEYELRCWPDKRDYVKSCNECRQPFESIKQHRTCYLCVSQIQKTRQDEDIVFLDLDGVLIDFNKRALEFHSKIIDWELPENRGIYKMEKIMGITIDEFWEPLNTFRFWENMEWTEDGKEILSLCESYCGHDNICLLTSPSAQPESSYGKVKWIKKHMPQYKRRFFIGCPKAFCARPNAHLIDDKMSNVVSFIKNGGQGLLLPRPWNPNYNLNTIETLKKYLEENFDGQNGKIEEG